MSWYKQTFGEEPEKVLPPILEIPDHTEVIVTFQEDHPRMVRTRFGDRPVINVKVGDKLYTLWLTRKVLARKIATIEMEKGTLTGVTVRILNEGKKQRYYSYQVEVIG